MLKEPIQPVSMDPAAVGLGVCVPGASKCQAYVELAKPRITGLILMVAVAVFWLASPTAVDGVRLVATVAGIILLAAGIFALNQYLERDLDARMLRTEKRPLPTGRLRPVEALWFGAGASALSVVWFTLLVNPLCGALAVATLASYLFLYTPMKRRTPHCTFVGAFPGAMPPLFGWAGATGTLPAEAWALFAILFLWQFPHFHSIAWVYRDDYARADIRMWPVIAPHGKMTARQIVGPALLLVPVSLLPAFLGVSGTVYLAGAVILGILFAGRSLQAVVRKTTWQARQLLVASVLYLPVLFGLMVLDKW